MGRRSAWTRALRTEQQNALKTMFEAFEVVGFEQHCRIIDPPRAVVHWRGTFRAKNGQVGETDILDLIEVRDGRIAALTTFFDTAYAAAPSTPP
jgi:ketosteroid isomerase-like protein